MSFIFQQDVQSIANVLPHLPEDVSLITVRRPTADADRFTRHRVRRYYVQEALEYLIEHNIYYRDVRIDQSRIDAIPVDDFVQVGREIDIEDKPDAPPPAIDDDKTDADTDVDTDIDVDAESDIDAHDIHAHAHAHTTPDITTPSASVATAAAAADDDHDIANEPPELEDVPASAAPASMNPSRSEKQRLDDVAWTARTSNDPLSEFKTPGLLSMAFPHLYPTGSGDFFGSRATHVSFQQYINHLMRFHDGRFAEDPRWRYVVFNMLCRRRVNDISRVFIRRQFGKNAANLLLMFDEQ
jgi:hypothetical protein